jgi:hypothetical protein
LACWHFFARRPFARVSHFKRPHSLGHVAGRFCFTIAVWPKTSFELTHHFRTIRCFSDVDLLRAGKTQPVVHFCLCDFLHAGFSLRISTGRMAFWRSGSHMVSGGATSLVASANPWLKLRLRLFQIFFWQLMVFIFSFPIDGYDPPTSAIIQ